ncbi:GNAT family N-acetyltransferase [Pseudonocardia humida]|uniref:GNAT family N-acetyltransferase n=1 Tax=Pseudonocardia humida TaxID=2800819 RepID=A0ABT1A3U4_9PSEU|nr:GNAT family N-acetyltransferase [Pseudonocardia humida]MCO1657685.1 GNAT family N-acetyltransferase [Pseudonocardia humida]
MDGELRLRELGPADEAEFRAGHRAMEADGFTFGLGLRPELAWGDYLDELADQRAGRNLREGIVPATFLVADVDGRIVGRTSVRHHLNAALRRFGGHIGYGVLPQYRRRGHATAILRASLCVARGLGITSALVTCDDDNLGSRKVIEACGGVLESVEPGEPALRRYLITT